MNMYRLSVIQPYRNHTIWLICALVIASLAVAHPPRANPCINTNPAGCSFISALLDFLALGPVPAPVPPPRQILSDADPSVANTSMIPAYLRATLTLVSVYMSTGEDHPGFPAVREATKARAPW